MEGLHKDEKKVIARHLTGQSLHAFFQSSKGNQKASQEHITDVQNLPDNEYLARIFNCRDATVIDQTLIAVVEFINYHRRANVTSDTLAKAIRANIANRIPPNCIRELMKHFTPISHLVGSSGLLRMDATVGMPNIQNHDLSDFQMSVALTMVAITLAYIVPVPNPTALAKTIDTWIVYKIHNNQESMRLAQNVAYQIHYWNPPNNNVMRTSPSKL